MYLKMLFYFKYKTFVEKIGTIYFILSLKKMIKYIFNEENKLIR